MGITLIIPVTETIPDIESIVKDVNANYEIIFINNGGDPKLAESIPTKKCKYIHNESKIGEAQCIGVGAIAATGEVICYIKADSKIVAGKDWLRDIYMQAMNNQRTLFGISWTMDSSILRAPSYTFNNIFDLEFIGGNHGVNTISISNSGFFIYKNYFKALGGLRLLKTNSLIGLNLSIKTLLEGGYVKVGSGVKSIVKYSSDTESVGNIFDKLVTLLTLYPEKYIEDNIHLFANLPLFEEAMEAVNINALPINDFRIKMQSVLNKNTDYLDKLKNIHKR